MSKKNLDFQAPDKRQLYGLVERDHPHLSIGRQCELLGLCRSGFYYTPAGESPENLCLMNAIDKLHTRHPYYGVERIRVHLPEEFQPVNAKRIRRLMHLPGYREHGRCAAVRWACGLGLGGIGDHALLSHSYYLFY